MAQARQRLEQGARQTLVAWREGLAERQGPIRHDGHPGQDGERGDDSSQCRGHVSWPAEGSDQHSSCRRQDAKAEGGEGATGSAVGFLGRGTQSQVYAPAQAVRAGCRPHRERVAGAGGARPYGSCTSACLSGARRDLRPPLKSHFERTAPALQMGAKLAFLLYLELTL